MAVGHRGRRAENAGTSGARSSSTMTVTITAKNASEYPASRSAVALSSRITHSDSLDSFWFTELASQSFRVHIKFTAALHTLLLLQKEHVMKRMRYLFVLMIYLALTTNASAVDILVCNDDGFTSANTRALYERLTQAGHRVIVAAPVDNQSGRGGYISFLSPIPRIAASYVDPYTGRTVVPRALKTYPGLAGASGVGTDPANP